MHRQASHGEPLHRRHTSGKLKDRVQTGQEVNYAGATLRGRYRRIRSVVRQTSGVSPGTREGRGLRGHLLPGVGGGRLLSRTSSSRTASVRDRRFSNFTGLPELPDNDPQSNPRGMAIRFQAPSGATTDIVAHSYNGFPTATVEELTAFLRALAASGPTTPDPKPITKFLASHPAAARFAQAPKPAPASFATESFYGVNAFRFTNRAGKQQFGRSQIHPVGQEHHLRPAEAGSRSPNYLFEELAARLKSGPARFRLVVQLAASGDPIADASLTWPRHPTADRTGDDRSAQDRGEQ